MSALLKVHDLSVAMQQRMVLQRISFAIHYHELVLLVGVNGAGKSSLLRTLAGLLPAASGSVLLEETSIASLTRRVLATKIAYLPQKLQVHYPIRVYDFLMLSRYPFGSSWRGYREEDKAAVARAVSLLDLGTLQDRWIDELSGGEQQRVCIASALVQGASLLLLDEPTASLDPVQQRQFFTTVCALKQQTDVSFVIASHQLEMSMQYGDRVLALADGGLIFDGTPDLFHTTRCLEATYGQDSVG
jgi:ABC-type cobalamin/Fe3+-siderophores transport system ATPase subunit